MYDWSPSRRQESILKQLLAEGDVWIFDLGGFDHSRGYHDQGTYHAIEGLRRRGLVGEGGKRYSASPLTGEWQNWSIRLTASGKKLAEAL